VLTLGGICVPPTVTYLPYRISGSTLTAVGRSQLLVRLPGTHSRILFGIQRAAQTVLGVYLKRTCSHVTSASSTLGVFNDYVLYKCTHSLTHSHCACCVLSSAISDLLVAPLQDRVDDWKKTVAALDREHSRGLFITSKWSLFCLSHLTTESVLSVL